MSDAAILDLERLREIYEDDREGIVDLLDLAVKTTHEQLDAVSAAVDAHNGPTLRSAAHAIKGAAFNVGATETAELAAALENVATDAQWHAVPAALTALREGFARLEERVARFTREG